MNECVGGAFNCRSCFRVHWSTAMCSQKSAWWLFTLIGSDSSDNRNIRNHEGDRRRWTGEEVKFIRKSLESLLMHLKRAFGLFGVFIIKMPLLNFMKRVRENSMKPTKNTHLDIPENTSDSSPRVWAGLAFPLAEYLQEILHWRLSIGCSQANAPLSKVY